ncbi:MAG: hypothetical protein M9894_09900 [Planctomycetes bacterium]|nr:hypothetical protein [Planctomycetota bacterium]
MTTTTRGMTLIEATFALALLAGGLLALASMTVSAQRLTRESTEQAHARRAAEARLSELRALLHQVSWTQPAWDQGVHDAQFERLLAEDGQARVIDLLDDTNEGSPRIPATITTRVFGTDEVVIAQPPALGAAGGLGLAGVDLDANGRTTDPAVAVADLVLVGVKVEVTWRGGAWRPGDPESVVRLVALLH